jgi:hypothetical protein
MSNLIRIVLALISLHGSVFSMDHDDRKISQGSKTPRTSPSPRTGSNKVNKFQNEDSPKIFPDNFCEAPDAAMNKQLLTQLFAGSANYVIEDNNYQATCLQKGQKDQKDRYFIFSSTTLKEITQLGTEDRICFMERHPFQIKEKTLADFFAYAVVNERDEKQHLFLICHILESDLHVLNEKSKRNSFLNSKKRYLKGLMIRYKRYTPNQACSGDEDLEQPNFIPHLSSGELEKLELFSFDCGNDNEPYSDVGEKNHRRSSSSTTPPLSPLTPRREKHVSLVSQDDKPEIPCTASWASTSILGSNAGVITVKIPDQIFSERDVQGFYLYCGSKKEIFVPVLNGGKAHESDFTPPKNRRENTPGKKRATSWQNRGQTVNRPSTTSSAILRILPHSTGKIPESSKDKSSTDGEEGQDS